MVPLQYGHDFTRCFNSSESFFTGANLIGPPLIFNYYRRVYIEKTCNANVLSENLLFP